MTTKLEAMAYYQSQSDLAQDRICRFESGIMSTGDVEPPRRDTTTASTQAEQRLIANYARAIKYLGGT